MKSLKFSLITFLFVSCSSETKKTEISNSSIDNNSFDTITIGSRSFFMRNIQSSPLIHTLESLNDSTDEKAIKLSNELVHRKSESLFLKCDNKVFGLTNNRNEENFVVFDFINHDKATDFYVVRCSQIESRNFLMVNKKNAEVFEVIGPPSVSPNNKFFVCGNCDLSAGFDVNGIQVYELINNSYRLIGLRGLTNWGPEKMQWKNDTTLMIEGLKLTGKGDMSTEKVFMEIYLK